MSAFNLSKAVATINDQIDDKETTAYMMAVAGCILVQLELTLENVFAALWVLEDYGADFDMEKAIEIAYLHI